MQRIILTIKDDAKADSLKELLKQFDFIEIKESEYKRDENYNFFNSCGLWQNREIDAEELRRQAWQRKR